MKSDVSIIAEKAETSLFALQAEFDNYQNTFFTLRSPEFFCLELNGEAGELANDEKKLWKGKSIPLEKIASEAADVFIALMNYSNARKINLGLAVREKLEYIDKRRIELAENKEQY
ncbi:MAG: hypothetical protein HW421_840 [Ignavibacteria bacterium]|nr:hypothetical protein [Ignavibacteria bacterium]